jgi:hypothetical protein
MILLLQSILSPVPFVQITTGSLMLKDPLEWGPWWRLKRGQDHCTYYNMLPRITEIWWQNARGEMGQESGSCALSLLVMS